MSGLGRRVDRLEQTRTAALVQLERDNAWFIELCDGRAVLTVIFRMAEIRADRRALHEGRESSWPFVTREERDALYDAERRDLLRHAEGAGDVWEALTAWCDEPDALGWPSAGKGSPPETRPGHEVFWSLMQVRRQIDDSNRRHNRLWQAHNPEWRPDMSRAEFLDWDLAPWVDPTYDGRPTVERIRDAGGGRS